MARVLLVMPRMPHRMRAPYLGQLYVAAALLRDGHEVQCIDVAAPFGPDASDVRAAAERFAPDIVGMTLFTWGAARGYRLAQELAGTARLLVAGGPHPTVCPAEPLDHGFDVSLAGEGERSVVALARAVDAGAPVDGIPGVRTAASPGAPSVFIDDLDELPAPHEAYGTFDMRWYRPDGQAVVPGGLMTSRGCPARCTFCANYVTGRGYRFRSATHVVDEMIALRDHHDVRHFPVWDDAFTALRPRLTELCQRIADTRALADVTWSCITPGNMVRPVDLARMRAAGCVAINFGLESGDSTILRIIQKGQRPEHVKAAVRAARAEGMTTIVNFMFGFPEEDVDALQRTLDLMDELSGDVDYFNQRGVLVPFPGTAVYDRHAAAFDLEGWWLDEANVPIEDEPQDAAAALRAAEVDSTLERDFFRYSDAVRAKIAECVRYKARHNAATIARLTRQAGASPPGRLQA